MEVEVDLGFGTGTWIVDVGGIEVGESPSLMSVRLITRVGQSPDG